VLISDSRLLSVGFNYCWQRHK